MRMRYNFDIPGQVIMIEWTQRLSRLSFSTKAVLKAERRHRTSTLLMVDGWGLSLVLELVQATQQCLKRQNGPFLAFSKL